MKQNLLFNAFKLALFSCLITAALYAQNSRGSLRGTVQDATGARIASARIVAQSSGSASERETKSEDRGEFRLDDLLPGNYRITVNATGFAPAGADVIIAVATVRDVVVTLHPASVQQSVNVQGTPSSVTTQ